MLSITHRVGTVCTYMHFHAHTQYTGYATPRCSKIMCLIKKIKLSSDVVNQEPKIYFTSSRFFDVSINRRLLFCQIHSNIINSISVRAGRLLKDCKTVAVVGADD